LDGAFCGHHDYRTHSRQDVRDYIMAKAPLANWSSATVTAADNAAKQNHALWYTFHGIGRAYLIKIGTDASFSADTSGVHGYPTIEQAYTNPNGVNALAQGTISQWDYQSSLPFGGGTLGVVETANITAPATPGGTPTLSTPQNPTTAAAKDVWHGLNLDQILLRVAEVLLGLALIGVGIARITGAQNAISSVLKAKVIP
jgi:hypothetical protein